jgi:hypothetical protein
MLFCAILPQRPNGPIREMQRIVCFCVESTNTEFPRIVETRNDPDRQAVLRWIKVDMCRSARLNA